MHRRCSCIARESRGNPSRPGSALRGAGGRRPAGLRGIYEVLQFLAGLEEGDSLRWHLHLLTGLGVAPRSPSPLAGGETAEAADFNLVVRMERLNDALEDGLDDHLRFLTRQLGHPRHF